MKLKRHNQSHGTLTSFGHFRDINKVWSKDFYPYSLIENGRSDSRFSNSLGSNVNHFLCFNPYWSYYTKDRKFFFSHPLYPTWYDKIIEEFNDTFENLKIDILDSKLVFAKKNKEEGWGDEDSSSKLIVSEDGEDFEFSTALLTLEVNSKYDDTARKRIMYFIHHFLRMISITEASYIKANEKDPGKDYLECVLNINNRSIGNASYRALSAIPIKFEDFLLVDKIELANKKLGGSPMYSTVKQTGIHERIAGVKKEPPKPPPVLEELPDLNFTVGDLVTGVAENPYRLTTNRSICRIINITSVNFMTVEIIHHMDYDEGILLEGDPVVGASFGVTPNEFVRVENEVLEELGLEE
jgi:hypothetical protein